MKLEKFDEKDKKEYNFDYIMKNDGTYYTPGYPDVFAVVKGELYNFFWTIDSPIKIHSDNYCLGWETEMYVKAPYKVIEDV